MRTPQLPGVTEDEQRILYAKLNEYNKHRGSFKEVGIYLLVLPRPQQPNYTLWIYSPLPEKQTLLYIDELSPSVHQSLRTASTMLYYSRRGIVITAYNADKMPSKGDDLIFFGQYRGHYLHEILRIDPGYLSWIAHQFTPRIAKQERFVKIAQIYHSVYLDLMLRVTKKFERQSLYLGSPGEKLTDLKLKVAAIKLEDDPYKTKLVGTTAWFYVKQILTLTDPQGNRVVIHIASKNPSTASCTLSSLEHAYQLGEVLFILSARILHTYESRGIKHTRLGHIKLNRFSELSNRP